MKYDAFISYRHLEQDMFVAKLVHKGLETTRVPKKLREKTQKKKINRVFRDQEELPAGSDLGANIEAALLVSEKLIVICSPQTKESAWVMTEIDTFIRLHGRENILAVLIDGEPADSIPPQLLIDEHGNSVEPLAADLRGRTKKEIKKKAKTEILRLAAPILGVDFDDLKQRHRERKLKRNMGIAFGVAALGITFGSFSAYNFARINQEYQQKLENESKVLASKSQAVLEAGDRKTATLIALEGMPENGDRPLVPESMYALSDALGVYDATSVLSSDSLLHVDYQIVRMSSTMTSDIIGVLDKAGNAYAYNSKTGEKLFKIAPEKKDGENVEVLDVCINDTGEVLSVVSRDGVRGYDKSGKQVYEYLTEQPILTSKIPQLNKCIVVEYAENGTDEYPDTFAVISPDDGSEVGKYKSNTEAPFSDVMDVDLTAYYLVIGHLPTDGVDNYLTVYDIENGVVCDIPVENDTTISVGFEIYEIDGDYAFGAAYYSANASELEDGKSVEATLQYYDLIAEQLSWSAEIESYQNSDDSSCQKVGTLFGGKYTDCGYAVICTGRNIYAVDCETGEIMDTISSGTDACYSSMAAFGEYFFCFTNIGDCKIYLFDDGKISNFYERNIKLNISQFGVTDSRIVITDGSTDIHVLYAEDNQKFDAHYETERSTLDGQCTPNGDYYYIVTDGDTIGEEQFIIYETKNFSEVDRFTTNERSDSGVYFLDDDTMLISTLAGEIIYYSIKDKSKEVYDLDLFEDESNYVSFSKDMHYAVLYSPTQAEVYDLQKRGIIYHEDFPFKAYYGGISNSGTILYMVDEEHNIHAIDIENDNDQEFSVDAEVLTYASTNDGKYLALTCNDNTIKVLDLETGKVKCSFDYIGDETCYIKFSNDGKQLYTQSSDNTFRIYDIEEEKTTFISNEFGEKIRRTNYNQENETLEVITTKELYLVDLENVGILARVSSGRFSISGNDQIVASSSTSVWVFHYMEADELIQTARKRYGDAELTEEQKMIYGIM